MPRIARQAAASRHRRRARRALPAVLLSGGETTVTVRGQGPRRAQRRVPAGARAWRSTASRGIHALACDTDGIDGTEDNAGALIGPDTLARAARAWASICKRACSPTTTPRAPSQALGDLVVTGPTLTNVNDFRAILVAGAERVSGNATPTQRQDRRHPRPRQLHAGDDRGACSSAGVDVFRLNFSHGKQEEHRARYDAIRALEKQHRPADRRDGRSAGAEAARRHLRRRQGQARRRQAASASISPRRRAIDKRAPLPHPEVFAALEPGTELLLDDGNIRLKVESCGKDFAETVVVTGGDLSDRKGVNVPERGPAALAADARRTAPISPSRSTSASTGSRSPSCSGRRTWPRRASSSPAAPACW